MASEARTDGDRGAAGAPADLVLVANARMPSHRAQSVQLARAAHAFEACGARTVLVHARRRDTPARPAEEVWRALATADFEAERRTPGLVAAPCLDWIDAVPRRLQYAPARLQEWTFGRSAARIVRARFDGALVLARDVEVARALAGRGRVGMEIHRVPGGKARRRWLLDAVRAGAPVVAISGGVLEDLTAIGVPAERVLVEHDAYDPALEDALPPRADARARLGIDADRPVVLYAGGLLRWKGVDVLVDAARGSVHGGGLGDALVVVVGGMDRDVEELRARAAGLENVRVDGFRPAHDVPAYLAAADVGVVPNRATPRISSHHTSPLKVFEAMAARLPLVVSDLPSLRDVLEPDEATFVPPEDPAALAEGIRALLDDADARHDAAARAYEAVRGHTWEARARRILAFLEQATDGGAA